MSGRRCPICGTVATGDELLCEIDGEFLETIPPHPSLHPSQSSLALRESQRAIRIVEDDTPRKSRAPKSPDELALSSALTRASTPGTKPLAPSRAGVFRITAYGIWLVALPLVLVAVLEPSSMRWAWLRTTPFVIALALGTMVLSETIRRAQVARAHLRAWEKIRERLGDCRTKLDDLPLETTLTLQGKLCCEAGDFSQHVASKHEDGAEPAVVGLPSNGFLALQVGDRQIPIQGDVALRSGALHVLSYNTISGELFGQTRSIPSGETVVLRGRLEERIVPLSEQLKRGPFRLTLEAPDGDDDSSGLIEVASVSPPVVKTSWPVLVLPVPWMTALVLLTHATLSLVGANYFAAHEQCGMMPFRKVDDCRVEREGFRFRAVSTTLFCSESEECRISGQCSPKGRSCTATKKEHCLASERCKVGAACSVSNGVCVASNDDCAASEACRISGHCTAHPVNGCVVGSDADCGSSEVCIREQKCTQEGPQCVLSCERTDACRREGRCSLGPAMDGGPRSCRALRPEDCRRSALCVTEGLCTPVSGQCRAESPADCEKTPGCLEQGRCSAVGGVCRVGSAENCRRAKICKSSGKCTLVGEECKADNWNDCAISDECVLEGRCLLHEGRCVLAKEWLKRGR